MTLEPLICPQCGAPVPLVHATSFPCPYCTATVAVPARYRTLFDANARAAGARREIEARYHNVVQAPPLSVDILAACLVLVLPAVVAVGYVWFGNPPSLEAVFTMAIIPALLPGAGVWVWSAAVHATIVRFELALACQPPDRDGGPGRCRKCGAPLEVETGAISARCAYCGTDSLLANVGAVMRRIQTALRADLRTLADAVVALQARRRLLVAGAAFTVLLLAALVAGLVIARAHVHGHH